MNPNLCFKLRTPKGQFSIENISPSITLKDFKRELSKKTGIKSEQLRVKCGYPPKEISEFPGTTPIKSLDISNGDLLIIEENPNKSSESQENSSQTDTNTKKTLDFSSIPAEQVPNKDGLIMIRRVVPADNSCLFRSVAYNLNPKAQSFNLEEARELIAGYILSNPEEYEGLLEKSPQEYSQWIMKDNSWGGEPELTILAKHYQIEICAVSVQTCQVFYYNSDAKKRMFVIYDGIHYDSVARNICEEITEKDVTLFDKNDQFAVDGCIVLANNLRKLHQYTDVNNFDIQCLVCLKGLKGERDVAEHSKETGHCNFKEIDKKK